MHHDAYDYNRPGLYLDGAATARPHQVVADTVAEAMVDLYGNPSSLHALGVAAETSLEHARKSVARHLGVDPRGIYFNSGATEGNNTVIRGVAEGFSNRGRHIIITGVEHPSVYEPARYLRRQGFDVSVALPDSCGYVHPDTIATLLTPETILVSVTGINSDVGTVQPLNAIAERIAQRPEPRPVFHGDLVQAVGRIPVHVESTGLDCATISAHKVRGPRGVGILYLRPGLHIPPLLIGGGQEHGQRSGTENVPGIMGTALALDLVDKQSNRWQSHRFREKLGKHILERFPRAQVNGCAPDLGAAQVAPHILNVSFPGLPGEILVHALEERGIYVSTGTACSSRDRKPNRTLEAMGLKEEVAHSAIRISWSEMPDDTDANRVLEALDETVPMLSRMTSGRQHGKG